MHHIPLIMIVQNKNITEDINVEIIENIKIYQFFHPDKTTLSFCITFSSIKYTK